LAAFGRAQVTSPQQQPGDPGREQKGLAALREAIAQSQGFSLSVNRIYIESTAAELLWTRDEALARSLVSSVRQRFRDLAGQPATDRGREMLLQQAWNMRRSLVLNLARHDPQLALEFMRATPPPASIGHMYGNSGEADLEMNLASAAAQSDAKLAASLVRQNLATSNSFSLANTVDQIASKDSAVGAQLAGEMVNRLVNSNFSSDPQSLIAATQLLQYYGNRVRAQQNQGGAGRNVQPSPMAISNAQLQALAQAIYTASQKPDFPASMQQMVQSVMPQIQSFVPTARGSGSSRTYTGPEFFTDLQAALGSGNMDQAMAIAAKVPSDYRNAAYQMIAARTVGNTGNLDAARQLLSDGGMSDGQIEQMMQNLAQQAAYADASRGAVAQARAAADLIRFAPQRAQAYIQIAQAALNRKDVDSAKTLLSDARSMLPWPISDGEELNAMAGLARAYLEVDPAKTMEILNSLVDLANEKMPALMALDGFMGTHMFYNGEMVMQYGGGAVVFGQVENALAALASKDAEQALRLASRIQRPEARVAALLAIARGLLGGNNTGLGGGVVYSSGSVGGMTFINR
jgi:hypothetical protein